MNRPCVVGGLFRNPYRLEDGGTELCEPNDQEELTRMIDRYRHLTSSEQAERILDQLGLRRQWDLRNVFERDGISLTTRKARPHSRWVSDWVEIT